ncbi:MAG: transposase family protein [Kofleriaceae bacterium]
MRDTDLYRQLLGLEKPWTVDRVELDVKQQRVDVWAKHDKQKTWPCPECKKGVGLHDHDEERTWRHLDSCGFQTHRTRCMSPVLFASSTFVHGGAHARAHESSERRAA